MAALLENKQRSDRPEPLGEACPRVPAPLLPSQQRPPLCGLWPVPGSLSIEDDSHRVGALSATSSAGATARSFHREELKTNRGLEGPVAGEGPLGVSLSVPHT